MEMLPRKFNRKQVSLTSAFFAVFVFAFYLTEKQMAEVKPPELKFAEKLKLKLRCRDRELRFEKLQYGSFWLLQNLIAGTVSNSVGCAETITYTTNGDYTFFSSLPMVLERWLAPISFALFAPGYDLDNTMKSIQYVRNCLPEKDLIRKYVSFHVYFPNSHMPRRVPRSRREARFWYYNCSEPAPYENVNRKQMYKTVAKLTYPINVGRNIARKAVNTYFILASDIELLPSPNIPKMFLEMVYRNVNVLRENNGLRVFPMPIFEVAENAEVPKTKKQLKAMLINKTAVLFHKYVCPTCHMVPNHVQWLNEKDTDKMTIIAVAYREGKFVSWEPFYISDNKEPMFDERISWEGQSNKRIQNFAMCLLNYQYLVMHPSFLVHRPGIKKFDPRSPRNKFVPGTNYLIQHTIKPEYKILYGNSSKCNM